ncbi:MAG: AAA family ATPase [Nocardioidaceae bacterium]|nr:AAA family ATPase [Nocardioidaceae bacterium]
MTTIVESRTASAELFVGAIGPSAEVVPSVDALRHHLEQRPDEFAVVLGAGVNLTAAVSLADTLRVTRPALSVILLRQRVDSSVLAEALRSGMREVVEERDLTGLSLAVRRSQSLYEALTAAHSGHQESAPGRLITVFSAKGGVGKTTVSTNLAVALSDAGHKVCLVDLDLAFGDVAITLQMSPVHTISEALAIVGDIGSEELRPLLTKYSANLSALLAPTSPELSEPIGRHLIGKILTTLKQSFDYIVVDTPPAFDEHVLQAFDESDLLLLLVTPVLPALKAAKVTLETFDLLNFPRDKSRIVLNGYNPKIGLSPSDIETALKSEIFVSIPTEPTEVPASMNRCEPIVTSHPRNPASQAFVALARKCVEVVPTAETDARPGLLVSANTDGRSLFRRRSKTS